MENLMNRKLDKFKTLKDFKFSYEYDMDVGRPVYIVARVLKDIFGMPNTDPNWTWDPEYHKVQQYFLLGNHAAIVIELWSYVDSKGYELTGELIYEYASIKYDNFSEPLTRPTQDTVKEVEEFIRLLYEEVDNYIHRNRKRLLREIAAQDTRYFLDPFHVYFRSASRLFEQANKNSSYYNDLYLASFFLFISSFEGFVNLLYELYLDEGLREDNFSKSNIQRLPIEAKILYLPHFCNGFSPIPRDDIFERWQALRDYRNNLIHANITDDLGKAILEIDGAKYFVDNDDITRNIFNLTKNPESVGKQQIEFVKDTVEQMVRKISDSMDPNIRFDFDTALNERYARK